MFDKVYESDERKRTIPVMESIVRLSDSYMDLPEGLVDMLPDLELVVKSYDFRMKKEEALRYIEDDILPGRWKMYEIYSNELLQYSVSVASIAYIQRARREANSSEKVTYQMPEKVKNVTDMIELLATRDVLKPLFTRKEVCDLTIAQFSREDIIRVSSREEGREEGKRDRVLSMYEEGIGVEKIAKMAKENIEVVRNWIEEDCVI